VNSFAPRDFPQCGTSHRWTHPLPIYPVEPANAGVVGDRKSAHQARRPTMREIARSVRFSLKQEPESSTTSASGPPRETDRVGGEWCWDSAS